MYQKKDKSKDKSNGAIPLVIDHNPGLPNMSKIINRNKHFLESDPILRKLMPKEKVFVASRKNKSIGDILVRNRYRPSSVARISDQVLPESGTGNRESTSEELEGGEHQHGCFACGKCYCCKYQFLTPCDSFTSFHTDQVFGFNKKITCQSTGLIYLAECVTCEVSDIGYTTGNLPLRFSNHKSHIKKKKSTCRLVNHFITVEHNLDFTSRDSYNKTLSAHLKVILIDQFDFCQSTSAKDREKVLEKWEGHYQTNLKTLERYGGLNVLDSRLISRSSSF